LGEARVPEVTAVPIRPLRKGSLIKLWLGLIALCLAAAALAWVGTQPLQEQRLEGGVRLRTLEAGHGPAVTTADAVALRYRLHVNSLDAPVLQDSDQTGQPFVTTTNGIFPGFAAGLQRMRAGGRYVLWLPPGTHMTTPPPAQAGFRVNDTLVFEIQVVQIAAGQAQAFEIQRMQQLQQQLQMEMQQQGAGQSGAGNSSEAAPAGNSSGSAGRRR
jgi:FKBP-type peptidyl-prolyl cis-trans isomerase FkpA